MKEVAFRAVVDGHADADAAGVRHGERRQGAVRRGTGTDLALTGLGKGDGLYASAWTALMQNMALTATASIPLH